MRLITPAALHFNQMVLLNCNITVIPVPTNDDFLGAILLVHQRQLHSINGNQV